MNNLIAYVTGGGQGLGRATALRFAKMGAKVVIVDMQASAANKVVEEIGSERAHAAVIDVTNEEQVQDTLETVGAKWGAPRALVQCAGIATATKVLGKRGPHKLADFAKVINVNTIGTFNMMRLVSEKMSANEPDANKCRGVIINTASVAAFDGQIGQAAYGASKGAVVAMTLPIARELASHGIRVCCIAPGLFMTPMLAGLPEKVQQDLASTVPFPNRLGDPDEYAMLAQSIYENPMLNGEVIRLDGALRMQP